MTLGQSVPKLDALHLMDGIEGLRSLPKHSVDMLLTDPPYIHVAPDRLWLLPQERLSYSNNQPVKFRYPPNIVLISESILR